MHYIFGNYGDNTIAVIQWAHLNAIGPITVINIDTGWGASEWQSRVAAGIALATKYQYETQTLTPPRSFVELVQSQQSFPTIKYQWCPTFLKALPLLTFLERVDPKNESMIMLGSRRYDSRGRIDLPEFIEESAYYGERKVWYPLYKTTDEQRAALVQGAGFDLLQHRSLECNPCIHQPYNNFATLDLLKIAEISALEMELNQTLFETSINNMMHLQPTAQEGIDYFDLGCGSRYVCGE